LLIERVQQRLEAIELHGRRWGLPQGASLPQSHLLKADEVGLLRSNLPGYCLGPFGNVAGLYLLVHDSRLREKLLLRRHSKERTEVGAFIHVLSHDRDGPSAPGQDLRCCRSVREGPAEDKEGYCRREENTKTGCKSTLH